MWKLVATALLALTTAASAQDAPHDFSQDTPPVPGQILEPPREKLRVAPLPLRSDSSQELGLPTNGPKGLLRESSNEPRHALRAYRTPD
jgi:hypothetical protein